MFSYQKILRNVENAPEFVTKDEFCTICGICPHYATKVLKNGLIPYVKRRREEQGAKRRYLFHYYDIATTDIIKFAKLYADISECNEKEEEIIKQYYTKRYEKIPDKLSIKEISELLGYDNETIRRWIEKGWTVGVKIRETYFVSKEDILNFVTSKYYRQIFKKSDVHKYNDNQIKEMI